jgi:hypothetical protein
MRYTSLAEMSDFQTSHDGEREAAMQLAVRNAITCIPGRIAAGEWLDAFARCCERGRTRDPPSQVFDARRDGGRRFGRI